jgi:MFS family permease
MVLFILNYFCAGIGYVISATFIVAIVERFPLLQGQGNLVWIIVGLAALPSSFFWDFMCTRMGNTRALLFAYFLEIASFLLPVFSDGQGASLASAALFGSTFVGIVSMSLSIIGRKFPNNPAKAMARLTLSYGVAQVVAPVIAGYLAEATGSYRGALGMAAVAMAVGMGLLIAADRIVPMRTNPEL